MNYALVEHGIAVNVIWLNERNAGDFPNAVKLGERPVGIGDSYEDGVFYRDGAAVLTSAEMAQQEAAQYAAALNTLGVETEESASASEE